MSDERPEAAAGDEASQPRPRTGETKARETLARLREEILACDEDLVRVVSRRCALVQEVGRIKRGLGLPVTDPSREASVVRRAAETARSLGLDEELVRDLLWKVMASARADQQ